MKMTILHNPSCSKSRAALGVLQDKGVELEIIEYLKAPLVPAELVALIDKLGDDPCELVRRGDGKFKDAGLVLADGSTADQVAVLLAAHPEVMQRPVIIHGDRAVIARPTEKLDELF